MGNSHSSTIETTECTMVSFFLITEFFMVKFKKLFILFVFVRNFYLTMRRIIPNLYDKVFFKACLECETLYCNSNTKIK